MRWAQGVESPERTLFEWLYRHLPTGSSSNNLACTEEIANKGRKMLPGTLAVVQPVSSVDQRQRLLNELQVAVGERSYQQWFVGKTDVEVTDDGVLVRVGSQFQLAWMQRRFGAEINRCVRELIGKVHIDWSIDSAVGTNSDAAVVTDNSIAPIVEPEAIAAPASTIVPAPAPMQSLSAVLGSNDAKSAVARDGRKYLGFEEFVVGRCNELAFTAARHAAEQPGAHCNPLYLHGPVGTGKTHLAEAIFKAIRRLHPNLRLLFMTAEAFANQFTHALRTHSLPSFRQRFRNVDVLFIDDAHFLNGKRGIQEEFLHTFQQLISHGKQVVLTSDSHPRLLSQTSDELVSRFLSGLVCRVEAPDHETRRKIAHSKSMSLGGAIAEDVLDLVARRFVNNVREIEGAINTLQTWFRMTGKRITLPIAKQVLSDLERDCVRVVKLADIESVVCNLFGMNSEDLRSDSRTRSVSQPRMLAMYLARKHTQAAYKEIGEFFGGRNHSTVMAAERKIDSWLRSNDDIAIGSQSWRLSELVERLEQQLLAS